MWTMLLYVACAVAGGIVLTVASGTLLVRDLRRWWFLVLAVAVVTALFNLTIQLWTGGVLYRDIVAVVVVAILCSVAIGATARSLRERVASLRVFGSLAVLAVFSVLTPFAVLITHCTSGDCL
jgi:hypothetical protein